MGTGWEGRSGQEREWGVGRGEERGGGGDGSKARIDFEQSMQPFAEEKKKNFIEVEGSGKGKCANFRNVHT